MKIDFDRYSLAYDRRSIINDVSVALSGKGFVAIVGRSGSGKSTLLGALTHQIAPAQDSLRTMHSGWTNTGKLLVDGRAVADWDPDQLRRKIGLVLQEPIMFPGAVTRNLGWILKQIEPRMTDIAIADKTSAVLNAVGLDGGGDFLSRDAQTLSGGQRQRLAIARALILAPEVLCMDEPTSALDSMAALEITQLIESLAQDLLVVVVTHDLRIARRADRVVLIGAADGADGGNTVLANGKPQDVLDPCEEKTPALVRADEFLSMRA